MHYKAIRMGEAFRNVPENKRDMQKSRTRQLREKTKFNKWYIEDCRKMSKIRWDIQEYRSNKIRKICRNEKCLLRRGQNGKENQEEYTLWMMRTSPQAKSHLYTTGLFLCTDLNKKATPPKELLPFLPSGEMSPMSARGALGDRGDSSWRWWKAPSTLPSLPITAVALSLEGERGEGGSRGVQCQGLALALYSDRLVCSGWCQI